ncbi:hypothetical protein COV16_04885, partial [Candidatus Woesearchaeota archaeon CG10_big_fil_rev_8_21_14_0_10_34_8]
IEPILNLRYRNEDIEVKNITLFAKNDGRRGVSFLINRYYNDVYIKENNLDEFIDKLGEEEIDLGGVLVHKGDEVPEVLPLQSIAFADQTDILGGPFGLRYNFKPSKLRKMASKGWGDKKNGATITIDELIASADEQKQSSGLSNKKTNRTTGKNIEIYIVRGNLPEAYLKDNDNMEDYYEQIHIVAFYGGKEGKKNGHTLYRKKAEESDIKFYSSKPLLGRAIGKGGAEALFNEQIWTNFLEIHKHKLIESASKVPLWTDDEGYANRQEIVDMENLEITRLREGARIGQVPTAAPTNIAIFQNSVNDWFNNAQLVGAAQDPLLGRQSYSGQTFKGQERLVIEGKSIHEYRKGKKAKFLEEIFRDWIIPKIRKEILKDKEFLGKLNPDEMEFLADNIASRKANEEVRKRLISGQLTTKENFDTIKQQIRDKFLKAGERRKIKIIKDELKDAEIDIEINIEGKQKDLGELTNKVLSIFQFIFSNPQGFSQVMQIPGMRTAFNDILEFSNISPANFQSLLSVNLNPPQQQGQPQEQLQLAQPQLEK